MMLRNSIQFLLLPLLILGFSMIIHPQTSWANNKYAALVMDADNGVILYQRNADKMLHPASLTKIMTLMMLFDALDQKKIKLNDRIYISQKAASMVPSKLNLPPGSSIRVQDAIYALVTKSANDIAVAVAEKLGKTETNFGLLMTKRAKELGMNRTRFVNASGLHHPRQVTTARDMAKMARYLINNQPYYYRYFATRNFTYQGKNYGNHNKLLGHYDGMDGIKTGYVQASGFNLVASAKRGNTRLIGVVFGGRTSNSRNNHMRDLLDDAFKKRNVVQIAKAPLPVPNPRRDLLYMASMNAAVPSSPVSMRRAVSQNTRQQIAKNIMGIHKNVLARQDKSNTPRETLTRFMKTQELGTLTRAAAYQATPSPHSVAAHAPNWGIQIGAFSERAATDLTLHTAPQKLPAHLRYASPLIAPIRGDRGWIYRAWLTGFTRIDAEKACTYYKDCILITPKSNL